MQLAMRSHVDSTSGVLEEASIGFEANAIAFYAQISGLAKDKVGYPIREISTNAWDAARGRFEVFLPTPLHPMFRVRDYGAGMSHADMMGRFARMYASDKRGGNQAVGGWGLGRFSPFAYLIGANGAGSFMVTSIFDGVARTYVLSLSEAGQPMLRLMGERPSEAESGLDVSFAVERRDMAEFSNKAREILWSFEPRPRVFPEIDFGTPVVSASGDGWTLFRRGTVPFNSPQVRMGCVSYDIDLDQFEDSFFFGPRDPVMFDVPIGSLSPTLSREALAYDARTKETISAAMSGVAEHVRAGVQIAVNAATNMFDACAAFNDATADISSHRGSIRSLVSWRDNSLPNFVSTPKARHMHLPAGWRGVDSFKSGTLATFDITPGTVITIQHNMTGSALRLAASGITGRAALWIRCPKADRDEVLAAFPGVPVINLDDFKPEAIKREKTTFRKRRVLQRIGFGELRGSVTDIDMAAGGFFIEGGMRSSMYLVDGEKWIERHNLGRAWDLAHRLELIDGDITVVLRSNNETLPENWLPLGPHLADALDGVVDRDETVMPNASSTSDLPASARSLRERATYFGTHTPGVFRDIVAEIGAEYDRLSIRRPRNNSDEARDCLNNLGRPVPLLSAAQARDYSDLENRVRCLHRTYKLFTHIVDSGWFGLNDRRNMLDHYFEAMEHMNAAAHRD